MSKQVQFRRGSESEHQNFIGASGEITVDTTNNTIRVHDGETVGGTPLARAGDMPVPLDFCNAAMPSGHTVDLTLGSSDTTYTAPADGYVYFVVAATAANNYARILAGSFGIEQRSVAADNWLRLMMPIRAGATYRIEYSSGATVKYFKFIYCQGSK